MKRTLLILTLIATGCVTTTDRFKLVSTETKVGTAVGQSKVSGESCRKSILLVPFERDGTFEDAVENAVGKTAGADALSDLKVKKETLFTLFYNYHCVVVEGTPVKM